MKDLLWRITRPFKEWRIDRAARKFALLVAHRISTTPEYRHLDLVVLVNLAKVWTAAYHTGVEMKLMDGCPEDEADRHGERMGDLAVYAVTCGGRGVIVLDDVPELMRGLEPAQGEGEGASGPSGEGG